MNPVLIIILFLSLSVHISATLVSKGEEVVFVLGATRPVVGAGSGEGFISFTDLLLDSVMDVGRKVVSVQYY